MKLLTLVFTFIQAACIGGLIYMESYGFAAFVAAFSILLVMNSRDY